MKALSVPDYTTRLLAITAGLALVLGGLLAFLVPTDVLQGPLTRILYLHVPVAWVAYLSFGVAASFAIAHLITRQAKFDRISAASAELGVIFTALTLITGMLWGRPAWGAYWVWEPRLTTTAILLAIYLGYFALRQSITDREARGVASGAIAILGLIGVPISYMSVYWWRGLHQTASIDLINQQVHLAPPMLAALLINLLAFSLVYVAFLRTRSALAELEEEWETS